MMTIWSSTLNVLLLPCAIQSYHRSSTKTKRKFYFIT